MKLDVILSNKFKKDIKLAKKRGYNLDLLDDVVTALATCQTLSIVPDTRLLYIRLL